MYVHFKLNLTVFLTTAINVSEECDNCCNSEIIKNQISGALDSLDQHLDYPEEKAEIAFEEEAVYSIEIDRDGEFHFQVLHCPNSLISTTVVNTLNEYKKDWSECNPAPWKESIKFNKKIEFVLKLEEEYELCLN